MEIYEVHTINDKGDSIRETDIREAVLRYVNDPTMKMRINIDGLVLMLDEAMVADFRGLEGGEY